MLRIPQCWVGFVLGLIPAIAFAQEPTPGTTSLIRSGWVRAEIAVGRLCLLSTRTGQARTTSNKEGGSQEQLSIQVDGQQIQLTYQGDLVGDQISLLATNERNITFRRQRTRTIEERESQAVEVVFRQPPEGKLTLRVTTTGKPAEYSADNLWQLLLAEDSTCQLGLEELLNVVKPQWSLKEVTAAVETSLLQSPTVDPRPRWDQLIAQLSSDEYAERMAADRELREAGKLVVGYLMTRNQSELDGEQRQRIRRILNDITVDASDSPTIAAALVRDDVRVWLRMLESNNVAHLERATAEVRLRTGRKIQFDPAASSTARHEVVQGLKKSLGLR